MAKKRKKVISGKHLIIISSIIGLNAMGMSYASWTDQLEIQTTLTTGYMEPSFCTDPNNVWINVVKDSSELGNFGSWNDNDNDNDKDNDNNQLQVTFDDNQSMRIDGTIEEGYKAFIHYCVVNGGSVPIKYKESENDTQGNSDGLKIQVKSIQSKSIEPTESLSNEDSNGNPKIFVQARNLPNGSGNGNGNGNEASQPDNFLIKLLFEQSN